MSRTKKAEINAEHDLLPISTLRSETDSDLEAWYKLIARLENLSLMGSADDLQDENKIRRMRTVSYTHLTLPTILLV